MLTEYLERMAREQEQLQDDTIRDESGEALIILTSNGFSVVAQSSSREEKSVH